MNSSNNIQENLAFANKQNEQGSQEGLDLIAPNQWGFYYKGLVSYGHSVLIDPWGTTPCCAPERPCLISSIIDLNYLNDVHEKMPVLTHRRLELYEKKQPNKP